MTAELREACRRAVHVLTRDGRILRAGRATLLIFGELGWRRTTRVAAMPPFVWIVELGYQLVARNRTFWSRLLFRRGDACETSAQAGSVEKPCSRK